MVGPPSSGTATPKECNIPPRKTTTTTPPPPVGGCPRDEMVAGRPVRAPTQRNTTTTHSWSHYYAILLPPTNSLSKLTIFDATELNNYHFRMTLTVEIHRHTSQGVPGSGPMPLESPSPVSSPFELKYTENMGFSRKIATTTHLPLRHPANTVQNGWE